jgi:hypothetical protein
VYRLIAYRGFESPSLRQDSVPGDSAQSRSRDMGLGPIAMVSLSEARDEAARCRALLKDKTDPIEARNAAQRTAAAEGSRLFRVAAAEYIENNRSGWKNPKHAQQWTSTLATCAYPVIGDTDVKDVDTPMMVRILQPIWAGKRETASRRAFWRRLYPINGHMISVSTVHLWDGD